MEIDPFVICVATVWGVILSILFFGGLWWTLKKIPQKQNPQRFLGYSFIIRTSIALGGFWLALNHSLAAFGITMAAFALMRFILTHRLGSAKGDEKNVNQS
ncbi:MAG: ATP synthase subunit I [Proteobacteria bacterium]|nr:ATP synthase subunit I [Pseudomonadota bacterium]